ncbi:hypothetical protein [Rhodomicrobium udaipurense]|uniref:Uncharacterized protein n=1 Tax=Rhodomicrobium udaipurense TaxID=1202716 RepID=A0A8I1KJC8_9HYPH|nr:hypothetical protein [Rhodomicrobium udaipurense]MBJ7542739.1 hypothetical protein [Rhodomicrobium udaipurense]
MEPFKALTLVAASAVISLVTAGAAGFYAGYSAGRGNLAEIKTYLADAPVSVASGSGGAPVSLKPVTDEIRALSARIEALAAEQPKPVAAPAADASATAKPVIDEIRALSRQLDGVKADVSKVHAVAAAPALERAVAPAPDYSDTLTDIREQVRGLALKMDKQEPKAPKALVDEIRSLSTAVQAQDSGTKRVVEEVRTGFASLQNAEPKTPKALVEEVRAISATISAQAAKPQVSVVDQIKILQASIESLKARLASGQSGGATSDGADLAQIRQLLLAATEQFGKCQTQLASYSAPASSSPVAQTVSAPAAAAISVSPSTRQEPAAVVFYDNVMLKKDQEKQYDEIGVRLALQAIGPKQVKVAVNRQGFGLAFGERKVFRSQDVECEINLMETNLNEAQARVSLSCKR